MRPLPFPLFDGYSATDSLSLSTDGHIPDELWRMALDWDLTHPLPKAVHSIIGSIRFSARAITHALAAAIERQAAREQRVTRDELLTLGLSADEVDAHALDAYRLALARTPGLAAIMGEAA